MKQRIRVTINRRLYEEDVEPRILLSHFLRENIGLTGTHIGCVVGECGACSVLLDGKVVKSCLHFAVQADGREVTTIEGLAKNGELSPIQEAFVKHYAFQCGYCTPGMVMTSHALLQTDPDPSEGEIRKALAGNLCMCTGYVQIVEAVKDAAENKRRASVNEIARRTNSKLESKQF
jgi:aerobic-type carbon monoxide dehydrogenase small subunit (CoxS/CutS family)